MSYSNGHSFCIFTNVEEYVGIKADKTCSLCIISYLKEGKSKKLDYEGWIVTIQDWIISAKI